MVLASRAKIISTALSSSLAEKMTRFCKTIDKIFKCNHYQTDSPKNIDHTASDAHCIKGYKLTVILYPFIQ